MTHTRWIVGTLLVALGAVGMGGCYYDFEEEGEEDDRAPPARGSYGGAPAPSAVRWTGRADTFRGDLGTVEGFVGSEATVAGSDYGTTSSSVRIDAENTRARWWAMTLLSITGSLRHPALVPGAHFVFTGRSRPSAQTVAGEAPPLFMTVLGCSGPRRDQFTYDQGAQEVTVDVSAGPSEDTRRLAFDAKFAGPQGEQHVTGSFVFEAP